MKVLDGTYFLLFLKEITFPYPAVLPEFSDVTSFSRQDEKQKRMCQQLSTVGMMSNYNVVMAAFAKIRGIFSEKRLKGKCL